MIRGMMLSAVMLLSAPLYAAEQAQPSEESVRKLMEVTGASNLANAMLEQMILTMRASQPNMPDVF